MPALKNILAVDDDPKFLIAIQGSLGAHYSVMSAQSGTAAMKAISQACPDLVLLDYNLPEISGLELLQILRRRFPDLPVLMLTGESDPETIISTMKAGASDYVIKGSEDFEANLSFRIAQCLERQALRLRNQELSDQNRSQIEANRKLSSKLASQLRSYEILGGSPLILRLKRDILKLKGAHPFVLITGENGTGKDLVARNLNIQEDDPSRPFVAVNCAAIPSTLFESEFFGHAKGSFTGATDHKIGQFKLADGGDLFLDEVGEIPLEMQAKLLRALQEKTFTPVGSVKPEAVDVRVIAATNRDLEAEVRKGRFREDLFYRLCQIHLTVPPLRQRPEDIEFLAEVFLKRLLPMGKLTRAARDQLAAHTWRGNIRELQNTIERAVVMAKGEQRPLIKPEHLLLREVGPAAGGDLAAFPHGLLPMTDSQITPEHFEHSLHWLERLYLMHALKLTYGNNEILFNKLGFSRAHYFKRKKLLGLSGAVEQPGGVTA